MDNDIRDISLLKKLLESHHPSVEMDSADWGKDDICLVSTTHPWCSVHFKFDAEGMLKDIEIYGD